MLEKLKRNIVKGIINARYFNSYVLCEVLNSAYPYKFSKFDSKNGAKGSFVNVNGLKFNVYIHVIDSKHSISFSQQDNTSYGNTSLTNTGDEFKVLSTVIAMTKKYVTTFYDDINTITFSADKDENDITNSRVRVYSKLFFNLFSHTDWKRSIVDYANNIKFEADKILK